MDVEPAEPQPAPEAATPRLIGLVAEDIGPYVARRNAEVVAFDAPRGARLSPRQWLETVAAMEGMSRRPAAALVTAVLERSGLPTGGTIAALVPLQRAVLAIAEAAVVIARDPSSHIVVVPQPPAPWPYRNDLRRLAASLLSGAEVVLQARGAWELLPLVEPDFIVDASGCSIAPPEGKRALLVRVFGEGEPYRAWRTALEVLGVLVAGGPIAHVLAAPLGVGPREVLAAAHRSGLDVLEVRDAFESA
jgi:hypothetical protein